MATYSTASLPLGFEFCPTDEQLISHYLWLKNEGRHSEVQIIPQVDFFSHDPWDLPALSVIKSDNPRWYFFCLDEKDPLNRRRKPTRGGFWEPVCKARDIMSSKGLIGDQMSYAFLRQLSIGHERTDWFAYCYRASEAGSTRKNAFVLWVLSKVNGSYNYDGAPPPPILDGLQKRLKDLNEPNETCESLWASPNEPFESLFASRSETFESVSLARDYPSISSDEMLEEFPLKTLENNINIKSQARVSGVDNSCIELNSSVQSVGSSRGEKNEVDEIEVKPRTLDVGQKTFSFGLRTFPNTITQHRVPQSFRMWAGLGLVEPPQN